MKTVALAETNISFLLAVFGVLLAGLLLTIGLLFWVYEQSEIGRWSTLIVVANMGFSLVVMAFCIVYRRTGASKLQSR